MINGTFETSFPVVTSVSFILSAITVVSLSSIKILDTGLSDSATWILFILIFGGLFYGVSVGQLYVGDSSGNINNSIMTFDNIWAFDNNGGWATIPTYIHYVVIAPNAINPIRWTNPNFDSSATIPTGEQTQGIVTDATNTNNLIFRNMPYVTIINALFAVMYMFGMYLMVSNK